LFEKILCGSAWLAFERHIQHDEVRYAIQAKHPEAVTVFAPGRQIPIRAIEGSDQWPDEALCRFLPHVAIDEFYLLLTTDSPTQRRLIGASWFA
jgi:hypothetical protein